MATYAPPLPPKPSDKEVNPLVDGETPKTVDKGVAVVALANTLGDPTDTMNVVNTPVASRGTAVHNPDVTVDTTTGGTQILAANPNRKAAFIQNNGSVNVRIVCGQQQVTSTTGIRIAAGATLILEQPFVPSDTVRAIAETGSAAVGVTEVI